MLVFLWLDWLNVIYKCHVSIKLPLTCLTATCCSSNSQESLIWNYLSVYCVNLNIPKTFIHPNRQPMMIRLIRRYPWKRVILTCIIYFLTQNKWLKLVWLESQEIGIYWTYRIILVILYDVIYQTYLNLRSPTNALFELSVYFKFWLP